MALSPPFPKLSFSSLAAGQAIAKGLWNFSAASSSSSICDYNIATFEDTTTAQLPFLRSRRVSALGPQASSSMIGLPQQNRFGSRDTKCSSDSSAIELIVPSSIIGFPRQNRLGNPSDSRSRIALGTDSAQYACRIGGSRGRIALGSCNVLRAAKWFEAAH